MISTDIDNSNKSFQLVKVWDPFIRIWHWLLMISVITGWLLGEFRTFSVMQWHIYCGYATGCLLLLRIIWGFIGPQSARFTALKFTFTALKSYTATILRRRPSAIAGHNPLGALSVIAILILLIIQVTTGLFSEDDGLFYAGPFAHLLSSSMIVKMTAIHNLVAKLVLVFVCLHIAAVLFYWWWKKENLIIAMITGKKWIRKSK